jgi:signal transduction histidine kinase
VRLPWPRRTARLRFTAVYSGLFLVSGVALLVVTYGLFQQATKSSRPHLPNIPQTPTLQQLHSPNPFAPGLGPLSSQKPQLPQALSALAQDQYNFAQAEHQMFVLSLPPAAGRLPNLPLASQLTQDQQQLTHDQQQLTRAADQLAAAVHQVAQAGTIEAAQRASDSHQLLVNSGIALAVVAVLAIFLGWLVAGRMLLPLRTITATARRISATNLRERLSLDHADEEFKRLGDTLDDLFARLSAAFESQRHFVANASHELRTPLTAERNLLQVALDDPHTSAETWRSTAQDLLDSNDEQKHLIEALLALASSESGLDHSERIDLADVCQTVLAHPGPETERLEVQLQNDIRPAPLEGDPRLIERLVANLVDNAIGHNVTGGQVRISTCTADGSAVLSVTNTTGPVIAPGDVDRLFQPFQRLGPRRTHHKNGHGLGLSIVRAIVITHHGTITADPQPRGGLTVTVTFPPPANANGMSGLATSRSASR